MQQGTGGYTEAPPNNYDQGQQYGPNNGMRNNQPKGGLGGRLVRREVRSTETKHFSKTSEFFVWLASVVAVLIAVLVVEGFGADRGWTLVTILSSAYLLSRGLAKAGSREPYVANEGGNH